MDVLPNQVALALQQADNSDNLLEVILDLGRRPVARFVDHELELSEVEVNRFDIDSVVQNIGDFDADNRAGLERTLHRISGIRNRRGTIVGLTCRVGRAVYGTIDIIEDLVSSDKSILILGKPGIGKTTMLREAARILAEKKRVVIVDTSNEIGGDGDVPHPAVGKARRMQVAKPTLQHEVMIEAVENHNPEVIVIDEIGRELETLAARTIAERGVQLIGTAHGRTLENLLLNPTLSDLVGGIESVTLSDEEARRRGTQKTVLERRAPPTFDILIEIVERDHLAIHPDLASSVDALVRGAPLAPEIRYRDENDEVHIEKQVAPPPAARPSTMGNGTRRIGGMEREETPRRHFPADTRPAENNGYQGAKPSQPTEPGRQQKVVKVYPYGVARNRLSQAALRLGVPAQLVRSPEEADVLVTLRTYYRSRQQAILEAEQRGLPIYVLRANTVNQMESALAEIFNISAGTPNSQDSWDTVSSQTREAIQAVLNGQRYVDLPPAASPVRRMQHDMARDAQLISHSYGKEPNRRVRIFRD